MAVVSWRQHLKPSPALIILSVRLSGRFLCLFTALISLTDCLYFTEILCICFGLISKYVAVDGKDDCAGHFPFELFAVYIWLARGNLTFLID